MAIRINKFENTTPLKKPTFKSYSKLNNYDLLLNNKYYEMGYYNFPFYQFDDTDSIFIVTNEYEHRLDLISMKFYNSPVYDWILEDINNIEDPIKEIVVGKKLIIPNFNKIV